MFIEFIMRMMSFVPFLLVAGGYPAQLAGVPGKTGDVDIYVLVPTWLRSWLRARASSRYETDGDRILGRCQVLGLDFVFIPWTSGRDLVTRFSTTCEMAWMRNGRVHKHEKFTNDRVALVREGQEHRVIYKHLKTGLPVDGHFLSTWLESPFSLRKAELATEVNHKYQVVVDYLRQYVGEEDGTIGGLLLRLQAQSGYHQEQQFVAHLSYIRESMAQGMLHKQLYWILVSIPCWPTFENWLMQKGFYKETFPFNEAILKLIENGELDIAYDCVQKLYQDDEYPRPDSYTYEYLDSAWEYALAEWLRDRS